MEIQREQVESSNLYSIGYDSESETLEIQFRAKGESENPIPGDVYRYFEVPFSVWTEFKETESKGKYFHTYIRNGGYRFEKQ